MLAQLYCHETFPVNEESYEDQDENLLRIPPTTQVFSIEQGSTRTNSKVASVIKSSDQPPSLSKLSPPTPPIKPIQSKLPKSKILSEARQVSKVKK